MKTFLLAPVFLALGLATLQAESAREIASKFEKQKIEAVRAYLDENPEAEDEDEALAILVDAHRSLGQSEPIPDLLQRRYELQSTGPDANLGLIINGIARPFVEAAVVSDQRDEAKAFLTRLKSDLSGHPQGQQVTQFLDQLGADLYLPGVGDTMDFAFTSLRGEEIDLSEMRGQVILVDFWATWCGPCIAEMPNVVEAYEKYHDKGFEIVGISLDENEAELENFIKENDMPWPQYFDGKGWQNELAQRFGISSIPATFLVGKDGEIVASNLRGDALDQAIEEHLGL